MSIYTVRFGVAAWTSAPATTVLYTAPTTYTSILTWLSITNATQNLNNCYIWLTTPAGSAYVFANPSVPTQSTVTLELRQVIEPGETLTFSSTIVVGSVLATGYQLS